MKGEWFLNDSGTTDLLYIEVRLELLAVLRRLKESKARTRASGGDSRGWASLYLLFKNIERERSPTLGHEWNPFQTKVILPGGIAGGSGEDPNYLSLHDL